MLLGAILICLVWVTLFFFLKNEHDSAERAAIQNSTNLAGAFEEHLSRSISELDRSLKIIRALRVRDHGRFDLVDWLRSNRILTDEVLQITIVDRDGKVTLGSFESAARTASDPRDSDYYRTHVNAPYTGSFVSDNIPRLIAYRSSKIIRSSSASGLRRTRFSRGSRL